MCSKRKSFAWSMGACPLWYRTDSMSVQMIAQTAWRFCRRTKAMRSISIFFRMTIPYIENWLKSSSIWTDCLRSTNLKWIKSKAYTPSMLIVGTNVFPPVLKARPKAATSISKWMLDPSCRENRYTRSWRIRYSKSSWKASEKKANKSDTEKVLATEKGHIYSAPLVRCWVNAPLWLFIHLYLCRYHNDDKIHLNSIK